MSDKLTVKTNSGGGKYIAGWAFVSGDTGGNLAEIVKRCNAYPKLVSLTKGFRDACKQNPTNNNETVAELIKTLLTELGEMS